MTKDFQATQVKIREFKKEDAVKAGNVVKRAMAPSLKDLPWEDARKILSRYNHHNFLKRTRGAILFVAEEVPGQRILGVIALKNDEVKTFYVEPECQGKGIGRRLFNRLKEGALKQGCKKLVTRSSPAAEPVYKTLGFKAVKKEWQEDKGRRFYNVRMEQTIN